MTKIPNLLSHTATSSSSAVISRSCLQCLCAVVRLREGGCTTPVAKGTAVCKVLFWRRAGVHRLNCLTSVICLDENITFNPVKDFKLNGFLTRWFCLFLRVRVRVSAGVMPFQWKMTDVFNQSGTAGGYRNGLRCARWNYKHCLEYLWWQRDGDADVSGASEALAGKIKLNASHREHNAASEIIWWCLHSQNVGVLTGFFMLHRSLVEEFRKTLCSLWQGSQTAFSPDSLFYTIWKIMPSFRLIS